nr:MAG TPA: hypothetical protein [Bacteriophage sp.]
MSCTVKSDVTRPHQLPPHPCAKCKKCTTPTMNKCAKWRTWFRVVWPIVTGRRARDGQIS